jgi:hypothetical protein
VTFDPIRPAAPEPFMPAAPEPFMPAAPEPSAIPTTPVIASPPVMAPPPAVPVAKRKGAGGGWLNVVLVIAAAVAIGGVAFAIGRSTAPASASTGNGLGNFPGGAGFPAGSFAPGTGGQPGFGRDGLGGGGLTVRGTVESVDGDSLTIKTASGQTIEVTTGASTTYNTQAPASASDVQAGTTVQVQLEFSGAVGAGRPGASATTTGSVGTAGSVTVIP